MWVDVNDIKMEMVHVNKDGESKLGYIRNIGGVNFINNTVYVDVYENNNPRGKYEVYEYIYIEELKDKSPFELSGGQKRRVAIAGVLAMEPSVLVLDEPTAGLDPYGRDEILEEIKNIFTAEGIAIVLVSHSMEDVAKLVDRILVMNHGKIIMDGAPREVFKNQDELESIGLSVPQITKFMKALKERGFDLNTDCITVEEARDEIKRYLERN